MAAPPVVALATSVQKEWRCLYAGHLLSRSPSEETRDRCRQGHAQFAVGDAIRLRLHCRREIA